MTDPQDIIDRIDVGLQTPAPDPTYGEVSPTNRETCARCPRPPADESDWCEGCRAYLLGDLDDPREERSGGWEQALRQRFGTPGFLSGLQEAEPVMGHFSMERLADEFRRAMENVARAFQAFAAWIPG